MNSTLNISSTWESFFFLYSLSFYKDSSLEFSVDDLLQTTRFFWIKNFENVSATFPWWLSLTSSMNSISSIQIFAPVGQLAPDEIPLLKFLRQIWKFPKFGHASTSSFSASFFRSTSSTRTLELWGVAKGSPRHAILKELLRWTAKKKVTHCCKRTQVHTFHQSNINTQSSMTSRSRFGLGFFDVHPLQSGEYNVTPKNRCNELVTEQPHR